MTNKHQDHKCDECYRGEVYNAMRVYSGKIYLSEEIQESVLY